MNFLTKYRASLIVGLIFLVCTLLMFGVYHARTLNGDIDNHILSSEMFGMPAALKEHGLRPLYGARESGWDGQFYYYMSNDILARADTASHIDAPSYRYQRIGLSLYAAAMAKLTGADWVSPSVFFLSYLALVLLATVVGAQLLRRFGRHPAWILLWSFSIGTQITLFNALPDAAADAFLILALAAALSGRIGWSILPFTLATLSREVYALFPSAILAFACVFAARDAKMEGGKIIANVLRRLRQPHNYYPLLVPGLVGIGWNIYVTRHFGIAPSAQAHGILGLPLVAWWGSLNTAFNTSDGRREMVCLLLFIAVLFAALSIAVKTLLVRRTGLAAQSGLAAEVSGVAGATLCFVLLYACFGPTVTGDYTGYFKAAAVFFYLIPLLLATAAGSIKVKPATYLLLLLCALGYTTVFNLRYRILAASFNEDQYTQMSKVTETRRFACFGNYDATIKVNRIVLLNSSVLSHMFGGKERMVVNVTLTNTGAFPFISSRNFGSVFMSFHWVDSAGKIVLDGTRSALTQPILPGQSGDIDIITMVPSGSQASLKLSPVQEGCAWFYLANPTLVSDVSLTLGK